MARIGTISSRTLGTANVSPDMRSGVRLLTYARVHFETLLETMRDRARARRARRLLASLGAAEGHVQVRPTLE